jgi:hypothetical protein
VRELDRTRTIDEGVAVAHEVRGGGAEPDTHLVAAGLGAGIADGSSGFHAAGLGNGAGARQYRFEKCGFTALERAHQCDAPGTAGTSGVLSHRRLLIWSSARDWVGSPIVSGVLRLGKREK